MSRKNYQCLSVWGEPELGAEVSEKAAVWQLCCLAKCGFFTGPTPPPTRTKVLSQVFASD